MKSIVLIIVGALVSAAIFWFGFTRQLIVVNGNIIAVNRFTDDAVILDTRLGPIQQRQNDEANKAADEEGARLARAQEKNGHSQESSTLTMDEEQLKALRQNVAWRHDGGGYIEAFMHNPFHDLRVTRLEIHIHCDAVEGKYPTIDRDYSIVVLSNNGCSPLTDCNEQISWNLPFDAQKNADIAITKAFFRKES